MDSLTGVRRLIGPRFVRARRPDHHHRPAPSPALPRSKQRGREKEMGAARGPGQSRPLFREWGCIRGCHRGALAGTRRAAAARGRACPACDSKLPTTNNEQLITINHPAGPRSQNAAPFQPIANSQKPIAKLHGPHPRALPRSARGREKKDLFPARLRGAPDPNARADADNPGRFFGCVDG